MLIAKIIGTGWMLFWFFMCLSLMAKSLKEGSDALGGLFSASLMWLIFGFGPIVIVKFGWGFIR
ncbi:hypothetical protein SAMN05216516_1218 [Izhakiella capsodis]|uniref:Uncharacterized protein n=1 Tax=Izhakiella capsodis TaxID=1367852 RepID=A0A1I5BSM9_9GAMM|nr:hypothetical protein SAMN05216516_1218 [Izhakiella capsodis]